MGSSFKLFRECDGKFFVLKYGENKVGRSVTNEVSIPELCVSRQHSIITVDGDVVNIKDCNSANGTYVGTTKIMPLILKTIREGSIIGFGCLTGITETYDGKQVTFVLIKYNENPQVSRNSLGCRITFQGDVINLDSDSELPPNNEERMILNDDVKIEQSAEVGHADAPQAAARMILHDNLKIEQSTPVDHADAPQAINAVNSVDEIIEILSDSENERAETPTDENMKASEVSEDEHTFVKEEYNIGDDDFIDSISDSEDDVWAVRLSQNSPGKPQRRTFENDLNELPEVKIDKTQTNLDKILSNIYIDDNIDEETYSEDLIRIPDIEEQMEALHKSQIYDEDLLSDEHYPEEATPERLDHTITADVVDAVVQKSNVSLLERLEFQVPDIETTPTYNVQLESNEQIEPTDKTNKEVLKNKIVLKRTQLCFASELPKKRQKRAKSSNDSGSTFTTAQKESLREERNRKLKEIANRQKGEKEKAELEEAHKKRSASVSAKLTNVNRGNFLTDATVVKTTNPEKEKRKLSEEKPQEPRKRSLSSTSSVQSDRSEFDDSHRKNQSGSKEDTQKSRKSNRDREKSKKHHRSHSKPNTKDKRKASTEESDKREALDKKRRKSLDTDRIKSLDSPKSKPQKKLGEGNNKEPSNIKEIEKSKIDYRCNNESKDEDQNDKTVLTTKNEKAGNTDSPILHKAKSNKYHNETTKIEEICNQTHNLNTAVDLESRTEQKSNFSGKVGIAESKNDTTGKVNEKHGETHPNIANKDIEHEKENIPKLSKGIVSILKKPFTGKKSQLKPKKNISFSTEPVKVIQFEIEPGYKMKKTSECKATMIQSRIVRLPLERQFLAFVLRWSTKWLEEQINIKMPPAILPHSLQPMAMCHAFDSYTTYERIISDLLLMELWESVTQAYMKKRTQPFPLKMQLEVPPLVSDDKILPTTLSVNLSLTRHEKPPRLGEVMLVIVEGEDKQMQLFKHLFYIHNIRQLPSPRNSEKKATKSLHSSRKKSEGKKNHEQKHDNVNQFFSISLVTVNTLSLHHLQRGAVMLGKTLCYIKNELVLMEAIEQLKWSPLAPVILRPEPSHFSKVDCSSIKTGMYTDSYNESQLHAVKSVVAAALSDRPSIQMIQGPPGTGKSSVITAIIMSYFYCEGRRQNNRRKILVCATSNAAVDELVGRLLKIRQNLPNGERFRMVRVGRMESMHPRAAVVSLSRLAEQNAIAARGNTDGQRPGVGSQEVNWLEAKLNSIRNQLQVERSKRSAAVPALEKRHDDLIKRIEQMRSACNLNAGFSKEELAEAERLVVENSDIVVTTLASVANNRLKCLVDRVAMCIVDEAGQAIEPETLMPLTLRVTSMCLIGDPRQLPGFINSQRAKKYGLGDSLFSRLSATTEDWQENPVILLDTQYRMHPAIADYPNRAFYEGRVHDSAATRNLPLNPYTMVFVAGGAHKQGESCANEAEAWGVARLVTELTALTKSLNLSLGVITPYIAQRDLIKRCLFTLLDKESQSVEVNTVDSFQGQERDVVVVSLGRSHGVGFLTDPGRVNVMLTRAKHALLICLNPNALMENSQWRSLIDDARSRSSVVNLPSYACHPTTAEAAHRNPILPLLYKKA